MTEILITFLISLAIMSILNCIIVALVILKFGYDKRVFWKIFKSDLKWSFTQPKIVCMIIFTAIALTIINTIDFEKYKHYNCEHCKKEQKCQTIK
jgi:hypothetical protein